MLFSWFSIPVVININIDSKVELQCMYNNKVMTEMGCDTYNRKRSVVSDAQLSSPWFKLLNQFCCRYIWSHFLRNTQGFLYQIHQKENMSHTHTSMLSLNNPPLNFKSKALIMQPGRGGILQIPSQSAHPHTPSSFQNFLQLSPCEAAPWSWHLVSENNSNKWIITASQWHGLYKIHLQSHSLTCLTLPSSSFCLFTAWFSCTISVAAVAAFPIPKS